MMWLDALKRWPPGSHNGQKLPRSKLTALNSVDLRLNNDRSSFLVGFNTSLARQHRLATRTLVFDHPHDPSRWVDRSQYPAPHEYQIIYLPPRDAPCLTSLSVTYICMTTTTLTDRIKPHWALCSRTSVCLASRTCRSPLTMTSGGTTAYEASPTYTLS